MMAQLIKSAFRSIRKNKTYSFLNIFGLATGIACAGLIALWIEDEMQYDRMHKKADQIYQLKVNMKLGDNLLTIQSTPRPMAAAIESEIPGILRTARYSDNEQRLPAGVGENTVMSSGRYADAGLFDIFSFDFLEGSNAQPFPQLYSIVITDQFANKIFGSAQSVIGKTIRIDNRQDYIVSGVIKELPENSTLKFEWLASYDVLINAMKNPDGSSDANDWSSYGPVCFAEVQPNADITKMNAKLKTFIGSKAADQKKESFLFPLTKLRLYNEFSNGEPTGGGRISQVKLFAAIAWIILLIACINFMNLATAGSQQRAREVGVRKVLGAGKGKLVLQFMSEAIMMSTIAMLVGVMLIAIAVPAFNLLVEKTLSPDFTNLSHIGALVGIALICGIVAGLYPAIYLSSFQPAGIIKGLKSVRGGAPFIRKGLVVVQFVVSVVFIISTIIVYQQVNHIKSRNIGFNRYNLVEINPQKDLSKNFEVIKQKLLETGAVSNLALAGHSTLAGGNTDKGFLWQGKPVDENISVAFRNVSPEFITVSGMRMLSGRDFTGNQSAENSNIIVNESMAKLMSNGSVIGQVIRSPRDNAKGVLTDMTIVGVVNDYVFGDIFGKAEPLILFCKPQKNKSLIYLRLDNNQSAEKALAAVTGVMKKENPGYPLEYKFVDDQFNQLFKTETLLGKISGTFAALAILISCLGLFGLAAFTAERRTKEIGIRKVLGASVSGVTVLLSQGFIQLVLVSCAIAFPLAWLLMNEWLQEYDYRIGISWKVFAGAGIMAVAIAIGTISFHSIKTALTNPVKSLKTE